MEDAAKTIAKLRRLAAGEGEEAKTAGEILKGLRARHPDAAAVSETEPTKDVWFAARNWHDRALMERLAELQSRLTCALALPGMSEELIDRALKDAQRAGLGLIVAESRLAELRAKVEGLRGHGSLLDWVSRAELLALFDAEKKESP